MTHLFVYGSLLFEEVRQRLLQHRYTVLTAELADYQRLEVNGATCPGLLACRGATVSGLLLCDVHPHDLRRLDRFEGKDYRRIRVPVHTQNQQNVIAGTYLFRNRRCLGKQEWDPACFRQQHLRCFAKTLR